MALTNQQLNFVLEYLKDSNAKQAAIRAGYSVRSAEMQGSRLMSKDEVRNEIERRRNKVVAKLELSAEGVLADIVRIAAKAEATDDYHAALKGRELLGKHLKLFTEKHEHSGITIHVGQPYEKPESD